MFAHVVDRADVRMADAGSRAGLAEEALAALRLTLRRAVETRNLEGHTTVELRVVGLVDRTHAAFTEPTFDAIAAECAGDRRCWSGGSRAARYEFPRGRVS